MRVSPGVGIVVLIGPRAGAFDASWIGFIRDDAYVHEWTGEIAEESDIGQAIGNAVTAYSRSSGKPIWGTTIMVDKA